MMARKKLIAPFCFLTGLTFLLLLIAGLSPQAFAEIDTRPTTMPSSPSSSSTSSGAASSGSEVSSAPSSTVSASSAPSSSPVSSNSPNSAASSPSAPSSAPASSTMVFELESNTAPEQVFHVAERSSKRLNIIGIVSWGIIGAGVVVVVIVLISSSRKPPGAGGGLGRSRYHRKKDADTRAKRMMDDNHYRKY
ncbi:MAG: hypothetical protein HFJ84_05040 [Clostridiales bacterium]|nr:hypothetical protein [Clostridiales bacterium]